MSRNEHWKKGKSAKRSAYWPRRMFRRHRRALNWVKLSSNTSTNFTATSYTVYVSGRQTGGEAERYYDA